MNGDTNGLSEKARQESHTISLSIEVHKRHKEFSELLELLEKFIAGGAALVPLAALLKIVPIEFQNSMFGLLLPAILALLTLFCVLWNPTQRSIKAGDHQNQWEDLRERYPSEQSISADFETYLSQKAKIKGEPRLPALTRETMFQECKRKGLPPPSDTSRPNFIRRLFMHLG